MKDLDWHAPCLPEKEEILRLLPPGGIGGCDLAFVNLLVWQGYFHWEIAMTAGCLLRRWRDAGGNGILAFPAGGTPENRAEALTVLEQTAGRATPLGLLTESEKTELESLRPGVYEFTVCPEDADYVYARTDLATLPGRKYMRKRNAVSQFFRRHPEAEVRPLTAENANDAVAVAEQWLAAALREKSLAEMAIANLQAELAAIKLVLNHCGALELRGSVLYADSRPAAMNIASPVNRDTADVHFEKALPEFARDHAYAVVNRETARALTEFKWINREEDMGDPDLRDAKTSYRPAAMLTRYRAQLKGEWTC